MTGTHWLILTSFLFGSYDLVSVIGNDDPLWVWQCDSVKEACSRISAQTKSDETLYPSLEVCRLICGKYGALWPRPTGNTSINKDLLHFSAKSIQFVFDIQEGDAKTFLQNVSEIFLQTLSSEDTSNCPQSTELTIQISVSSGDLSLNWNTREDYSLKIVVSDSENVVNIISSTVFGARHALETLSQLIDVYPNNEGNKCLVTPSQVAISDAPVYPHRGLLIDTARNFLSTATIKKHIIGMAASKLNILHWHITDSQSFPLELPSLPNMTRYGAYSSKKIYSVEEIKELLFFAKLRGVRILIEIDSPSHAGNGWQWGPDAGMGNLAVCINQEPYRSYCIQPPCGQLNPINPNLYKVLKMLYKDIVDILPEGEVFHMGGDEIFIPCWNSTPEIIEYLNDKPRTTETFLELWADFQAKALEVYDSVASATNTPIILWTSDLTEADVIEKYLSKERYVIQTWVPAADSLPTKLLALGYRIIASTKDAWYLDHGFWGSTVYHNWRVVYNNKIPTATGSLGGEVCMWGEYVDDSSVESRAWPRAAAAAERLWSNPTTNSYQAERRFYRHRERLVSRGVNAEAVAPRWCYQNEGECS